ncbi:WD40 repeat-like protein [Mycena galericulata]|nr:WD40 repeat-like protein [Mycena galericulata]
MNEASRRTDIGHTTPGAITIYGGIGGPGGNGGETGGSGGTGEGPHVNFYNNGGHLEELEMLKTLHPLDMDASLRTTCLPRTRRQILQDITDWATANTLPKSGNILWLSGVAGSGKSTISTTISESFQERDLLGAFLFFNRDKQSLGSPGAVVRTIAYSLGRFNPDIGKAISAAIHRNPGVVNAVIHTQFKLLLLGPLRSIARLIRTPVLIIMDALDECGDPGSRAPLLSLLSEEFPKLPQQFRLVVTSRPDSDIIGHFQSLLWKIQLDPGETSSMKDVALFIHDEMNRIQKRMDSPWQEDHINRLIQCSGGLFIWAATAIRFINHYRPNDRLQILITQTPTTSFNLDSLYRVALCNSGPWEDTTFSDDAHAVLACIVLGREPMTDETIDKLLQWKQSSRSVLDFLGCVIQWSPGNVARVLHASFTDYLIDPSRSGGEPWAIDQKTHHRSLALACLQILYSELKFNICDLENSHVANADAPGLSQKITKNISPQLSYSSRFWFIHIEDIPLDKGVLNGIEQFLCHQFLHWLEVLSLLEQMSIASTGLQVAAAYVKEYTSLKALAKDAFQFVRYFGKIIAHSAPHIYLSALPFAPTSSLVFECYAHKFLNTLSVQLGRLSHWPALQMVIEAPHHVTSLAFSPDGQHIASGSADSIIRMWDAATGVMVVGPFSGHTDSAKSIAFSPGGQYLASGSDDNTICMWDVATGMMVAGPFTGHTDCVTSIAFSPDGRHIASGSYDSTIHVLDAATGERVVGPFNGHKMGVNSIAFSADGKHIASGSADHTICVWNATTGVMVMGPFKGHTGKVRSIAFSPDGQCIASGSADSTIRMWDAGTGIMVVGPFSGHTDSVNSIAFSPDGQHIASGSDDHTVRMWNAATGVMVAGPFNGHIRPVRSIAFSPDGLHIASGSDDRTIRVWDATAVVMVAGPSNCHTNWVNSVAFSADGKYIASGSADGTICIWDAATGVMVRGPLKGHTKGINSIAFSPDGQWIASGSVYQTIQIWDSLTGVLVRGLLHGHTRDVNSIAFSPDGQHIASGSSDCTICVLDAVTGVMVVGPLKKHVMRVNSITFSQDGQHIASGSADQTLCLWDATTGVMVAGPFIGHTGWVNSIAFSPDGQHIASGSDDHRVCLWDAATGIMVAGPFNGHTGSVRSVAFSPDGLHIASGSDDRTIRVWARDGIAGVMAAGPFNGHTGSIRSIAFSPDGQHIASGSTDHTIRMWVDHGLEPMSCPPVTFIDQSVIDRDGWIRGADGELLVWLPDIHRSSLHRPSNVWVRGENETQLDLHRFCHGKNWASCYTQSHG